MTPPGRGQDILGRLDAMLLLAEAHLVAARQVDVEGVHRLNAERVDALFGLQVAVGETPDLPAEVHLAARERLDALRRVDTRTQQVARLVTDAVAPWAPSPKAPTTYGRKGQILGRRP